jgi:hypothetical protein
MSQTFPEEKLIRGYFLGELAESEQERLERRLLADPEFFEETLVIEDELADDYLLGLLTERERIRFQENFLRVPQRRREVELAKVLMTYTSGAAAFHDSELRWTSERDVGLLQSLADAGPRLLERGRGLASFVSRSLSRIARRLAGRRLEGAGLVESSADDTWVRSLSEAQANRNLLGALLEKDWAGLRLLAHLRADSTATITKLEGKDETSRTDLRAVLERLTQCGLVEVREEEFSCTELGAEILARIERATATNLTP